MITAVRHTGLVVADMENSLHFWCDVLGFRVMKRMEEFGPHIDAMMGLIGVRVTTAKLSAPDGSLVELLCFHSHPSQPRWDGRPFTTGLTHLALTVADLDETCVRLSSEGVTFPAPPQRSPDGTVRVIYATGPEGVLLELVEVLTS